MKNIYLKILKIPTLAIIALALSACFDGNNNEENVAPLAADIDLITQTETLIQGSIPAIDVNGDSLTYEIVSEPLLGNVMLMAGGSFIYTPNNQVTGADTFTYSVTDGQTPPVNGTVNITIEALQVSFADTSREAFNQAANDTPLPVNGREFTQDVAGQSDYQDLIDAN